jgi:hypothetical protein
LLARVAEDEAVAQAAISADSPGWIVSGGRVEAEDVDYKVHDVFDYTITFDEGSPSPAQQAHIAHWDPRRVLRECAALRLVVTLHNPCDDWSYGDPSTCPELVALAAIYGDHPDYREGWKP